ncbi:MAG: hypothetical protein ACREOM_06830, partial [Candidatus Dormibacteraceae bacterium]
MAALAFQPAAQAAGPHMSAHLSFVEVPDLSTQGPDAMPHTCVLPNKVALTCYGPSDLRKVYNFPSNLDGTGQTIIVVEAYGSPTIATDLAFFYAKFGIRPTGSFQVINGPSTGVKGSGMRMTWAVETSLDVEYAQAMAPGANIVLAVAATDNNFDIN